MNLHSLKPALAWLKSVYSEADGTGSSTRIHISLLTSFVISVGVSFGIMVHKHSISVEQFNQFLVAGGTFIATTCGPLYGVNKVAEWAKNKNDAKQS